MIPTFLSLIILPLLSLSLPLLTFHHTALNSFSVTTFWGLLGTHFNRLLSGFTGSLLLLWGQLLPTHLPSITSLQPLQTKPIEHIITVQGQKRGWGGHTSLKAHFPPTGTWCANCYDSQSQNRPRPEGSTGFTGQSVIALLLLLAILCLERVSVMHIIQAGSSSLSPESVSIRLPDRSLRPALSGGRSSGFLNQGSQASINFLCSFWKSSRAHLLGAHHHFRLKLFLWQRVSGRGESSLELEELHECLFCSHILMSFSWEGPWDKVTSFQRVMWRKFHDFSCQS